MNIIFSTPWFILIAVIMLIFAAVCWDSRGILGKLIKFAYYLAAAYGIVILLMLTGFVVKV